MNPEAYLEMAHTESTHWWFKGRREIIISVIQGVGLSTSANILEVGCGTGGNLEMLSRFGEVSALEMDAEARKIAQEKTNGHYIIKAGCCPEDVPFQEGSFDLICLFDVLEHIGEDAETLMVLKKLLKKDGVIILTVPAYQWLYGPHDVFLHHKRRYSAKQLKNVVRLAQLQIKKISYFNTLLFPLAVIARFKDKLLGGQQATGTEIPPTPINSLFMHLFRSEKYILKQGNLPFGVSLLCVLTR
jgi:SAM-dependent methyltransferase